MNRIRIGFLIACAAFFTASSHLHAQTAVQRITVSLIGQYQTNAFFTNLPSAPNSWTSEHSLLRTVLITTANVIKSLAVDIDNTSFTNWTGSVLVREVNLTNGHSGIFLRKGVNQTNVSSFFGNSFSNDFMAGLSNAFPGYTNNISGQTNGLLTGTNVPIPQTQIFRGYLNTDPVGSTNIVTNYTTTSGLYFISLNTTNIKFNVVGVGSGAITRISGGTSPGFPIASPLIGAAGSYYLNLETNLYDMGTNPPGFVTGPIHGTINFGAPYYLNISGP